MCDCIDKTNKRLQHYNAIETNIFGTPMVLIRLYKIDAKKKGKPPLLQASFCPFCSEQYKLTKINQKEKMQ